MARTTLLLLCLCALLTTGCNSTTPTPEQPFPCVMQADDADCGPSALASVLQVHNPAIKLEDVKKHCAMTEVGTSLYDLKVAAERMGFVAQGVNGNYDELMHPSVKQPSVAHVISTNGYLHFVAIHSVNESQVIIADPSSGVETLSRQEFEERWTGYLLLVEPPNNTPSNPSE